MTQSQMMAAVERARELLANPERVVLDPMHYVEISKDGALCSAFVDVDDLAAWAQEKRDSCRVCMYGAASIAAIECGLRDKYGKVDDDTIATLLTEKAKAMGVPRDEEVARRYYDDTSIYLTSALMHGMAVQVCDAVLADLRKEALV
jgi:hypothetical protein